MRRVPGCAFLVAMVISGLVLGSSAWGLLGAILGLCFFGSIAIVSVALVEGGLAEEAKDGR